MRLNQLLAITAVAGTAVSAAHAQDVRTTVRMPATSFYRYDAGPSNRAAIGIGTGMTGTLRDTLGVLITSITRGSPAEKAGLEEGNRISAINGVSLRANAADIEDADMSNALTRRLTRELGKAKPGDDVELRVYRDGRSQDMKIKTTDADSLFRPTAFRTTTKVDAENRPTLGISVGSTGSRRDTLGVLVMSVADSSSASKAGIEEGNRISAINGVSLRVAREDAGDRYLSTAKAQRLQREVSQLKVGDNVTLRVYSSGQFRDVAMKVGRAGDLPKGSGGMTYMGDGFFGGKLAPMPPMPAMPRMVPTPARPPLDRSWMEYSPDVERAFENARVQMERAGPDVERAFENARVQVERAGIDARMQLDLARPLIKMQLDDVRPQIEQLRMDLPQLLEPIRERIRMMNIIV